MKVIFTYIEINWNQVIHLMHNMVRIFFLW